MDEYRVLFAVRPYQRPPVRVTADKLSDEQLRFELERVMRADIEGRTGIRDFDERTRNGVNQMVFELSSEALKRGWSVSAGRPE